MKGKRGDERLLSAIGDRDVNKKSHRGIRKEYAAGRETNGREKEEKMKGQRDVK